MHNSVFRTFLKYSSRNALGMIGISCYILADTFFVARGLGEAGLTALNLAVPVYSFIAGVGMMVGMGGATRFSLLKGSDNKDMPNQIFSQSMLFGLISSIFFVLLGLFFAHPLSRLLGADASVHDMTVSYLRIILLFSPMFITNNILICFVRNDGNPKLSMFAMLIGSFSNIILDYIFIFPFGWGMLGAALATGVAPIVSMLIMSAHFKDERHMLRMVKVAPKFKSIMDVCSLGVSSLITELSTGVVMIVFNIVILKLEGNLGVAAYGIIANLALVMVALLTGIAQGVQPIISHHAGSGNINPILKTYRYAIYSAVLLSAFVYALMFFYANPIIGAFNKDGNELLLQIALNGLHLYFTAFVFVGINIITLVYFAAIDKPKQSFAISALRGFVLILLMIVILSKLFGMQGVWVSYPVAEGLTLFVSFYCLKKTNFTI